MLISTRFWSNVTEADVLALGFCKEEHRDDASPSIIVDATWTLEIDGWCLWLDCYGCAFLSRDGLQDVGLAVENLDELRAAVELIAPEVNQ